MNLLVNVKFGGVLGFPIICRKERKLQEASSSEKRHFKEAFIMHC